MIDNLSVFFPCFNEEGSVTGTVNKAITVLERLGINYEITIVNDGSTDKTAEVADSLSNSNPKIKVIHHPKNLGYGEALKSGFYNAKYDVICYTDGDGQFNFEEVTKFIYKLETADLIIGYRIKRADPFYRILFAKGWTLSLLMLFGMKLKDVDCGFKMVKREVLEKIPKFESKRGAMINAELVIKAKKFGFRVSQVGVNHFSRTAGKPTGASIPVIVRSYFDLLKLWWKYLGKLEFFAVVFILFIATFLRYYGLPEYMTFLGDEGRDALMIRRILVEHDLPLIGPTTSIGNIYLGPLYYYMMAVPMAIFWLNPVAAAYQVAFIGVLTVLIIYYLGKIWFGSWSGWVVAFLYAISPVNIIYSRSSWNPNPAPLFALISIWSMFIAQKSKDFRWLILTGAAIAAASQMHYLALILIPITGILWLYSLSLKLRKKLESKYFFTGTLGGIFSFFVIMSPLVVFDLKHNFLNYRAITAFFSDRQATVNLNPFNTLERIIPIFSNNLIGRYITQDNFWLTIGVSLLVIIPIIITFWRRTKGIILTWSILALSIWLTVGVLGLALYKQNIYDHYLGFLNPVPYLLIGALISTSGVVSNGLVSKLRIFSPYPDPVWLIRIAAILLILTLTYINLQNSPLKNPPNNQVKRTQEIAKFVISEAENKPFNFALIAKSNYDAAYQFYLGQLGHKPKTVPAEITDQLFVVCEDPVCEPINHPKYEIAGFGMAKIEKEQIFSGVKVFKLISNPNGKP